MLNVVAIALLIPVILAAQRKSSARDGLFWASLSLAAAGPMVVVGVTLSGPWRTDIASSLWVTVAASLALYLVISILTRESWRLTPILVPYMGLLALLALFWQVARGEPAGGPPGTEISAWTVMHIVVSVATYGLVTIAAVAALAAAIQERALKLKRQSRMSRTLPSVADCDGLVVQLLAVSEVVLALGMVTGMALQYGETGAVFAFEHKTVLTIAAFVVIGGVLWGHHYSGLRGRKAARIVLLAYLLMTLGYLGVKFVTDIVLA